MDNEYSEVVEFDGMKVRIPDYINNKSGFYKRTGISEYHDSKGNGSLDVTYKTDDGKEITVNFARTEVED